MRCVPDPRHVMNASLPPPIPPWGSGLNDCGRHDEMDAAIEEEKEDRRRQLMEEAEAAAEAE